MWNVVAYGGPSEVVAMREHVTRAYAEEMADRWIQRRDVVSVFVTEAKATR